MITPPKMYKDRVPEWAVKLCIFMLLVPNLLLFTISTASINAACGFYGIDPNDANYSLIVLYAGLVSYFPFERRFAAYLVTKDYLLISLILEIGTTYGAWCSRDLVSLLIFRFLQGIANISLAAICISLIFNHLKTERAREIGYSVVYCILLCISPVTTILTAPFLDTVNYNELYLIVMYAFLPGGLFAMLIMNRERLIPKIPLDHPDWQSFVIYAAALLSLTYLLVYGQQLNWFSDPGIIKGTIIFAVSLITYIIRQRYLKQPYLNLDVYKYPAYRTGIGLIIILYLARGAFNFTTLYFTNVLGMDPAHLGNILIFNILGAIAGTLISSRLMIFKRSFYLIWQAGFAILLTHYIWMIFLFSNQANDSAYYLPLLLQGTGAGMLLTPIIVFMVTSVPPDLGPTAGATAVSMRLLGTTLSIAIINYFQLYDTGLHLDRFKDQLSATDPAAVSRLKSYQHLLLRHNSDTGTSITGAAHMLKNLLDRQVLLKTAIDYYTLISILIFLTIIALAILPGLHTKKSTLDSVRDIPV
ncbi:MFS transporter [Mucilaginibacter angelicae]|uniref:MFS transporter n=1 Tax=Mucilaginibacter angelicae TaxID=869718 RepID=A0ABV6KZZ1_9SPHI